MVIEIRQIDQKDFAAARKFAVEGMHLSWYVNNQLELSLYSRYAFYAELSKSTIVLGAYLDNRLAGFLFASFQGEPVVYNKRRYAVFIKIMDKLMSLVDKEAVVGPYEQANQELLAAFFKQNSQKPVGELTFFAVDPNLKGQGIGTLLLKELTRREKGKLIYLFTDSGSIYQVYEHRGFALSGKKEINMTANGKSFPLDCYLFSRYL